MRKINLPILLFIILSLICGVTELNASSKHKATSHQQLQIKQKNIDINTATVAQLQTLKRIGLKKAAAIVAYREQHGAFKSIDDLVKVKGLSQTIVSINKEHLEVS